MRNITLKEDCISIAKLKAVATDMDIDDKKRSMLHHHPYSLPMMGNGWHPFSSNMSKIWTMSKIRVYFTSSFV